MIDANIIRSNMRSVSGRCWRLVEAQHHVSTAKLTDTREEQQRLEALLDEVKPAIPPECRHLHYLLFTPFRYGATYPRGSRFRRAGFTPGVFYAAERARTAAVELAFYRLLFFAESPATPWPGNPGEYTAFAVNYAAGRGIDLRAPSFDRERDALEHRIEYAACQQLADTCRAEQVDVIRSNSVRDPGGANVALLTCRAFADHEALERQTWRIKVGPNGASVICEFPKFVDSFDRAFFATDPRIAAMVWER